MPQGRTRSGGRRRATAAVVALGITVTDAEGATLGTSAATCAK